MAEYPYRLGIALGELALDLLAPQPRTEHDDADYFAVDWQGWQK